VADHFVNIQNKQVEIKRAEPRTTNGQPGVPSMMPPGPAGDGRHMIMAAAPPHVAPGSATGPPMQHWPPGAPPPLAINGHQTVPPPAGPHMGPPPPVGVAHHLQQPPPRPYGPPPTVAGWNGGPPPSAPSPVPSTSGAPQPPGAPAAYVAQPPAAYAQHLAVGAHPTTTLQWSSPPPNQPPHGVPGICYVQMDNSSVSIILF